MFVKAAREGTPGAAKVVREICRAAVEGAPDGDLVLIADAIIALAPRFGQELPDAQRN